MKKFRWSGCNAKIALDGTCHVAFHEPVAWRSCQKARKWHWCQKTVWRAVEPRTYHKNSTACETTSIWRQGFEIRKHKILKIKWSKFQKSPAYTVRKPKWLGRRFAGSRRQLLLPEIYARSSKALFHQFDEFPIRCRRSVARVPGVIWLSSEKKLELDWD